MFNLKEKIDRLTSLSFTKTKNFVYSYYYPIFIALIALLFWVANLEIVGVCLLTILACFILSCYDELTPAIPILFIMPMCFRDSIKAFETSLVPLIIIFAFLLIFLVLHFIRFPIKKVKFDNYFYMLLCVFAVYLFGGLFSSYMKYFFEGIDKLLIVGLMPLVIHFILKNKVKLNDEIDYKKYFLVCVLCAINLACVQIVYAYFHIIINGKIVFKHTVGWFCWANSAQIADLLVIGLPIVCYLMVSSNNFAPWLIQLALFYFGVFVTGSDACLAIILTFSPICIYALYKYSNKLNKKIIACFSTIIISALLLVLAYILLFDMLWFETFLDKASSGSGRVLAYMLSIDNFFNYPIFGVGFGGGNVLIDNLCISHGFPTKMFGRLYHSTFFQLLGCSGIMGITTYIFYYIVRFKYINSKNFVFNRFITILFVIFAVCGMIDNSEFNVVLLYMTTIISVTGIINENGSTDRPLPLAIKNIKF